MISLPPKNDDEGAETRLLLAECAGPSMPAYTLSDATTCMQLMDRVLWNRFINSDKWRKGATSIADIIRVPNQFAGFEKYPSLDSNIENTIQSMVSIANNTKDKRSPAFVAYINVAKTIATTPGIPDPSLGTLAFWRTANHGSPGGGSVEYKTVLGNTFFYIP
jgi:hypothetical protein